jgi:MFS family permease
VSDTTVAQATPGRARGWFGEHFGGLPSGVWWLAVCAFANRVGDLVAMFLVIYLQRRGFSVATAGTALTAYGVGSVGAGYAGGAASDRFGRRAVILVALAGSPLCLVGLALAHDALAVFASVAAFGLLSTMFKPASAALLADLAGPDRLRAATATYRFSVNAGYAVGGLAGGFALAAGPNAIVLGDGATSLLAAALAAATLPRHPAHPAPPVGGMPHPARRGGAVTPRLALFLLGTFALSCLLAAMPVALPLRLGGEGLPASVFGAIISLNALVVMVTEPVLTLALRSRPLWALFVTGAALYGTGLTAATLVAGAALPIALTLVWTTGEMLFIPTATIYLSRTATPASRGWYQGLYVTARGVAATAAPATTALAFAAGRGALAGAILGMALLASACFAAQR